MGWILPNDPNVIIIDSHFAITVPIVMFLKNNDFLPFLTITLYQVSSIQVVCLFSNKIQPIGSSHKKTKESISVQVN